MFKHSQKDIKDQIKEEFQQRTDKYRDLTNNKIMPTSNESLVIIPCLTKTYGFKTNQYKLNNKYLKGVINQKDFNSFLRKVNKVIEKELINKSNQENEPFFKFISILLKVSIAFSVLSLLLFAIIIYTTLQSNVSQFLSQLSCFILSVSGSIACLCPIFLHRQKYSSLNYERIISQKLMQMESEQNKFNASRRMNHLIWKIQQNFFWVELHINRIMFQIHDKPLN